MTTAAAAALAARQVVHPGHHHVAGGGIDVKLVPPCAPFLVEIVPVVLDVLDARRATSQARLHEGLDSELLGHDLVVHDDAIVRAGAPRGTVCRTISPRPRPHLAPPARGANADE